jgi:hypothetical protein
MRTIKNQLSGLCENISECFLMQSIEHKVRGASKTKLKKVNIKRTVTVRRVVIFFKYLKASIADLITLLSSSVQNSKGGGDSAIVVLTPVKNFNKVFWGFLAVSPLFNHFLGYV